MSSELTSPLLLTKQSNHSTRLCVREPLMVAESVSKNFSKESKREPRCSAAALGVLEELRSSGDGSINADSSNSTEIGVSNLLDLL